MFNVVSDIKEIFEIYPEVFNYKFPNHPLVDKMDNDYIHDFFNVLKEIGENPDDYQFKFAYGFDSWDKTPCVGFVNENLTGSFVDGLLFGFLFSLEDNQVFGKLAVCYNQFDTDDEKIKYANIYRSNLDNIPEDFNIPSKFYQAGDIIYKTYNIDDLDENEFISDFNYIISAYNKLMPVYKELFD
ncbi:hypothetical protein BGI41_07795 [Methanobrevibacter sp. 87.7]|uniref:MrcB family domain-containing protein n=1 Tax=Methanobrevibacter sp. 87.7 TaxID=387957 RepID=UPI000B50BC7B|nr:DUF3578 domain-containing protein [Methanobrevibacter sp. 87.7]OWT32414.1 hypothetical protein BGI41_07795 [Methanobrevibacter sp. 87.7]